MKENTEGSRPIIWSLRKQNTGFVVAALYTPVERSTESVSVEEIVGNDTPQWSQSPTSLVEANRQFDVG